MRSGNVKMYFPLLLVILLLLLTSCNENYFCKTYENCSDTEYLCICVSGNFSGYRELKFCDNHLYYFELNGESFILDKRIKLNNSEIEYANKIKSICLEKDILDLSNGLETDRIKILIKIKDETIACFNYNSSSEEELNSLITYFLKDEI